MTRSLTFSLCLVVLMLVTVGSAAQDQVCETFSSSPAECGYPYGCKSNSLNTVEFDDGPEWIT